jgi:hypothetical protein
VGRRATEKRSVLTHVVHMRAFTDPVGSPAERQQVQGHMHIMVDHIVMIRSSTELCVKTKNPAVVPPGVRVLAFV